MKQPSNSIGIPVNNPPKEVCNDKNCPYHGTLKVHGRIFVGKILSTKASKSATVGWERRVYVPKFERYSRRLTKLHAHLPSCIKAEKGDFVRVMTTRPLSKTKSTVVIEKIESKEVRFVEREFLGKKRDDKKEDKDDKKTDKHDKQDNKQDKKTAVSN